MSREVLIPVVKLGSASSLVRLMVLFEVGASTASSWRWIGSVDQCGVRGYLIDGTALAGSVMTAPPS